MKKLALYKCFNPRTHTGCDEKHVLHTLVEIHELGLVHLVEGYRLRDLYPFLSGYAVGRIAMPGGYLDGLPETLHALLEMRRGPLVLVRPSAIYQGEILPMEIYVSCKRYLGLVDLA